MLRLLTMAFALAVAVVTATIILSATERVQKDFRASLHHVSDSKR